MKLAELVARLGLDEVARRLGVKPSTVRRWLREGPSRRGGQRLDEVIQRFLRQRGTDFFFNVPRPPKSELADENVKPSAPPAQPRGVGVRPLGRSPLKTADFVGEVLTFSVDLSILDVDARALADRVIALHRRSGFEFCRVIFIFQRFIAYNPLYKGSLAKDQGKWRQWWSSTESWSTPTSLRAGILDVLAKAGIHGQRRVIWLQQYQVHLFDPDSEPLGIDEVLGRDIR